MPSMKVTQVAICPSRASQAAARPALTPELLAASGARYSRNNEGLDSILSKIDPNDLEKSVDSIFRMVDYGHQSIADMVPVAMFIDGISIWLAYYIWTLCPTAGGQESSTRYLKIALDGLVPPELLGIPEPVRDQWRTLMTESFSAYQAALGIWEGLADTNPALMGIPSSLLKDSSDSAKKKVARMRRNYAFDRSRYFLPVSAATNVMMIMSARGWVGLCQFLLSHPIPEAKQTGELIRAELQLAAPRMLKYARPADSTEKLIADEFQKILQAANHSQGSNGGLSELGTDHSTPILSTLIPQDGSESEFAGDLAHHPNRYAPVGSSLQRTAVRFGWHAIALAEIRDLNRHRTGSKYCPQIPKGFYFAQYQLPATAPEERAKLFRLAETGRQATSTALSRLKQADPSYVHWSLLGTEYPFEHTTTADKFLYEAELRTGLGAHFRYAKHLKDVLSLWYERFPSTKGLVLEGTPEPE